MLVEQHDQQDEDDDVPGKVLQFDETIDSQGQRPGTLASTKSKMYGNTGLSLINYNSTSNKLYVKRTPAAESHV